MKRCTSVPELRRFDINNFDPFFKQLSKEKDPDLPILKLAVNHKPKKYYEYLSQNMPKFIEIEKDDKPKEIKFFEHLNSFQQIYHDYNNQTRDDLQNYTKLRKENNGFCGEYHKIEKKKAHGQKNNYINNNAILSIMNRYHEQKRKIPDLSFDKNIFKTNPLILGNAELESFFLFHREPGHDKKSELFLNKINDVLSDKTGSSGLNRYKRKGFGEYRGKNYMTPLEEIEKHQRDIKESKDVFKNLDEIEDFFKTKTSINMDTTSIKYNFGRSPIHLKQQTPSTSKRQNIMTSSQNLSTNFNSSPQNKMSPQNIKNNIVKLRPPVSRDNKSSLYKKASQSVDNDQEKKGNKNIMYSTLEKLFRASNDLNTVGKNIGDIKTYLKKNRYNINNIDVSAKGAYSTIQRTKDIMLLKNYIKEDYDIRRDRNAKIALSEKQLAILSENDRMEADLNLCDNILKRLIYEGHIEKESLE